MTAAGCRLLTATLMFSSAGQLPVPAALNAKSPTLIFYFIYYITLLYIFQVYFSFFKHNFGLDIIFMLCLWLFLFTHPAVAVLFCAKYLDKSVKKRYYTKV